MQPTGLLQPLPLPDKVWSDISMDFIEGFPLSSRYSVIMVVVDWLSKYGHFIPLKHPFTAHQVAKVFIRKIVCLHGIPTSIMSDRDRIFISFFWRSLFQLHGTKLHISSSYHPQSDGQTEVLNHILEQYLRYFTSGQLQKWVERIPWAEFSYNT